LGTTLSDAALKPDAAKAMCSVERGLWRANTDTTEACPGSSTVKA